MTGRFGGVDPLAGKYYNINPYAYVANNPIKYIDPNGQDRRLIYDHKNQTITIQATYYHSINTGNSTRAGVAVFNSMKNLSYTDGNGTKYQIVFDLRTKQTTTHREDADKDAAGNFLKLSGDLGEINGNKVLGLGGGKMVNIQQDARNDDFVVAHEMGHTLGMAIPQKAGEDNHAESGLMTKTVNSPKSSKTLDQKSVNEIIINGKGPVEEKQPSVLERIWDYLFK